MNGLTTSQASQLLKQYGPNMLTERQKKNFFIKLIEQFNDVLIILLLAAAIFSFYVGEVVDGTLIISIVFLNAFFGLYQEKKAEESLEVLKKITVTKVRVIRDGHEKEIDSKDLVPGDLVYIEEGSKIPSDGQLVESVNLEINESLLTGESAPVVKNVKEEVYSGTIVSLGRGKMVVTKTGMSTKFGIIANTLSTIDDSETPLQKKLANLSKIIGIFGASLAIVVFFIARLEGSGYFPSFLLAISLAIAVVPEGLPAVMTVTLSIGTKILSGKKAIIRKLSAIEAIGGVTLIATDKTGTLTTNKMKVKEIFIDNKVMDIAQFKKTLRDDQSTNLLLDGILCSTASLVHIHDRQVFDVLGDPTEGALLYLAQDAGLDIDQVRASWQLVDEKPFSSVTKIMTVTVKRLNNKVIKTFIKGAPESILNICKMSKQERKEIEKQVEKWAKYGLRVLAFATGQSEFIGMVAIHDAPRPEVKEALEKARKAGIKVVMVTGDNEKTAEAVATDMGLIEKDDEIINGAQIENYSDEELLKILPKVRIFARTNPFQKHRIVRLYQQLGEVVAVTGDGVNDAIALKQADVGIAMGQVGTDVAREVADIIITDDNFATIINAVEEGRRIINNIKNVIKYLFACNVSEAITLVIGLVLGLPTFLYPIQILYINLVTDGLPALMLSFSPKDPNIMAISPQKEMVLLKKKDQGYVFLVGSIGAVIVIISYFLYNYVGLGQVAAFSVLTMIQSFVFIDLWLSHRHIHQNLTHFFSPFFLMAFIIPIVLQLIIVSHPFSASIFKILPVSPIIFIQFLTLSILAVIGTKLTKKILKF